MQECKLLFKHNLHHLSWCISNLYRSSFIQWWIFLQQPLSLLIREEYSQTLGEIWSREQASNKQETKDSRPPLVQQVSTKVSSFNLIRMVHRLTQRLYRTWLQAIKVSKAECNSNRCRIYLIHHLRPSKTNSKLIFSKALETTSWRLSNRSLLHPLTPILSYLRPPGLCREVIRASLQWLET